MVLCGGYARRLWPLTLERSKPLLPIGDKCILDLVLEKLFSIGELNEIVISTNKRFKSDYAEYVSFLGRGDVSLFVEETMSEEEKLGAVAGLDYLIREKGFKDDLLVVAGDNVFSFNLRELISLFNEKGGTVVALYNVKDLKLAEKYGVAELNQNKKLVSLVEKPRNPLTTTISTGCYIFPRDKLSLIHEYLDIGGKRDAPGYLLEWLHQKTDVYGYIYEGYWFDIGDFSSYLEANRFVTSHRTIVSDESKVEVGSKLFPPVVLRGPVSISNSKVGPNVLLVGEVEVKGSTLNNTIAFGGTEIVDSKIRNCVIDEGCIVKSVKLEKVVLGKYSKVNTGFL